MDRQCKLCKGGIPGIQFFIVMTQINGEYKSAIICPGCRETHAAGINKRGWLVYINDAWADEMRRDLNAVDDYYNGCLDALEAMGEPQGGDV